MQRMIWVLVASAAIARGGSAQQVSAGHLLHASLAFDAHATLGAFTGSTAAATGAVNAAPNITGASGSVEAPAASLASGNGHRDRDMQGSLESKKYPLMRFDLRSVSVGTPAGDSTAVTLAGTMTIHGQRHTVEMPGWLWLTPTSVRVRGAMPLNCKDYGIGGLSKFLGVFKMDPDITVRIDATFGQR